MVDAIADLRGRDVVFTMVSSDKDLEQVLTGDGGLIAEPGSVPKVVVDTLHRLDRAPPRRCARPATPSASQFLASPVSGNGKVVAAGKLTLVTSGDEDTFHRVRPLLEAIGQHVTYVGDGDTARLAKICHNLMLGVVTQSLAEITVLAEKGGMTRAAFLEFLNNW